MAATAEEEKVMHRYKTLKMTEIEEELTKNKQLIEMTKGDEDGDEESGSDSEPSEDNLSDEEIAKLVPVKRKPNESPNKLNKEKTKKPAELVRKPSGKKIPAEEKSPSARNK